MKFLKKYDLWLLIVFIRPFAGNAQFNVSQPLNINRLVYAISDSLNRHYVFPDKAATISTFLLGQIKNEAYKNLVDKPEKLAEQIARDINSIHHDPHLRIRFEPSFVQEINNNPAAADIERIKKYWKENNYTFKKAEILPGNIGYLPFNLFVDDIDAAKPTINAALKFLGNTSAIIIDLRQNMGGSPQMVSQIESYFFKEKTHMNDLINRSSKDTTILFADPLKADGLTLTMPVYILTNHNTFSGAEDFSYGMQVAKRAIIVGVTTGGGAHPQMPFSVGQGFVVFIPYARSLNPITKTDWEGTGVIPDVKVTSNNALIKAQELVFRDELMKATNEKDKAKYRYWINSLLANDIKASSSLKSLLPFTGTFGDLKIYLDKNKLLCKNENNGGTVTELKHLINNLFTLDQDAQIGFVKDSNGHYSAVKIFVNDGNVFEEKRTILK